MQRVSLKQYLILVALTMLGLASCASTPPPLMVRPVEVQLFSGDVVDRERLRQAYISILSADGQGEILIGRNYTPLFSIYPSVTFDRGGIGVRTVVTIDIKSTDDGRSVARRSYSRTMVVGSENRDATVESLLEKSVPFVRETLRRYNDARLASTP